MNTSKLAKLANLPDTSVDIDSVLELVSKLQSISTDDVLPTSQVTGQTNVFRDDVIETDRILMQEEALSNAKKTKNGYFIVPKIFV